MAKTADTSPVHSRSLRILYLRDYLMSNSDRDHGITVEQIQKHLESNGIPAERKTIYSDLDALKAYGDDIVLHRGKTFDYRISSRFFEDAEINLLVNAVESCKFITRDKSLQLINKLGTLTSVFHSRELKHRLLVDGQIKTQNESVYDTVNAIYECINSKNMLSFKYFRYGRRKQRVYGHNGKKYTVSPLGVYFSDNNYYLLAYSPENKEIRNYRADRIADARIINPPKEYEIPGSIADFDIEKYTREMFSMFGGEPKEVVMQFHEDIASQVVDRFGTDLVFIPEGETDFRVKAKVVPSPTFYSWIASFAGRARILDPPEVVDGYRKMLESVLRSEENDRETE